MKRKWLIGIVGLVAAVSIGAGSGYAYFGHNGATPSGQPASAQQTPSADAGKALATPADQGATSPSRQMRINGGTYTPQCTVVNGVKECKPINY